MSGYEELIERLRKRTKRVLPSGWRKERKCPECDAIADRPKCMWDLGARCPRHDPDEYNPSPYQEVPDKDCHDAAEAIEALLDQRAM